MSNGVLIVERAWLTCRVVRATWYNYGVALQVLSVHSRHEDLLTYDERSANRRASAKWLASS